MFDTLKSMFESVAGLFTERKRDGEVGMGEGEIRYWVERWLREKCGSEAVYCEYVRGEAVGVRVGTGWLRQEVTLWQEDLLALLQSDLGFSCKRVQFVY